MDLDEATAQYWEVIRAYNARGRCRDISTEEALIMLSEVLAVTGPHHPLAAKVLKLREDIIHGE